MTAHALRVSNTHLRTYMSCINPHKAFWTGSYTENGKLDLVIMPGSAGDLLNVQIAEKRLKRRIDIHSPAVKVINGHYYLFDPLPIPCGKCVACRVETARQWKVRLCDEFKDAPCDELHFVTLTYRDSCLPVTKDGQPCLCKKDLDDFIMALRRPSFGVKAPITFFACGEYGDVHKRPHFHIVMRYKLNDLKPYAWQSYHSAFIDSKWRKGVTQIKPVEPNMIAYVCGYCEKKEKEDLDAYPVRPFTSKSKGLGFNVIPSLDESLLIDARIYGVYGASHQSSLPRAYMRKLEALPWYPELKAKSIETGKKLGLLNQAIYDTTSEEKQGSFVEARLYEEQSEKRISKL